jgi:sortase A
MGSFDGRRLSWRRLGVAAAAVVVCAVAGGWALAAEDGPAPSDNPVAVVGGESGGAPTSTETTATTAPPTTAVPTTTTTTAPLPAPAPAPTDPYAETQDVVHGTLALPTLGVQQRFGEGVTLTAIDRGPSHWPGTAMPGQVGNVVVAGHRVTHTRPFYDLDLLRPGDPLVFTMNDGTTWTYRLVNTEIVDPSDVHIVEQTRESTATLFACHPKHSAAQRIVAHFRLVGH